MRQVPSYLIIGNGRLAKHLARYFSLLQLPTLKWDRSHSLTDLPPLIAQASHVIVAISDYAIEEFIKDHLSNDLIHIHCSGSLITSHAFGAHPLFTFNDKFYDFNTYQSIPFVVDEDAPSFSTLLPGLQNPSVRLSKKMKAKYHALCVLSSNFSCLLWQKLFNSFEKEFNLPSHLAKPLMLQQTQNLYHAHQSALTGPLSRNDHLTIKKNLDSLVDDPFQSVYQSFVDCYATLRKEINE